MIENVADDQGPRLRICRPFTRTVKGEVKGDTTSIEAIASKHDSSSI